MCNVPREKPNGARLQLCGSDAHPLPVGGLPAKRRKLLLLQKLQNLLDMIEANHASQLVELLCCAFLLSFTRQTLLSLAQRSKSAQENDKIDKR